MGKNLELRLTYENEWLNFSERPRMSYFDDFDKKTTLIGQSKAEIKFPRLLNGSLSFSLPFYDQTNNLPITAKRSSLQKKFNYIKLSLFPLRLISNAKFFQNVVTAYEQKNFNVRTILKRDLSYNGTMMYTGDEINTLSTKEKLYLGYLATYYGSYYISPPRGHFGVYLTQIERPSVEQNVIQIRKFSSRGPYCQLENLHFWMRESTKFNHLTISLFLDEATFDLDFNTGNNLAFIVYGMSINYGKTISSYFTIGHEMSKSVGYSLFKLSAMMEWRL